MAIAQFKIGGIGGFRWCSKLSERQRPKMKIQFRKRRIEVSDTLRAYVEHRLGFALGRFEDRLGPITVRFSDVNGHRRGVDKRCQIDVNLRPLGSVQAVVTDTGPFTAVDRAAALISRSVAKAIKRARETLSRVHPERAEPKS
jgi:putative sigma-54 modulation protein